MTRRRAGRWWPFHGPATGLGLARRFGAAPDVRVKYPCDQRIRGARVTLRWRGPRSRVDRPRIPTLLYELQRRVVDAFSLPGDLVAAAGGLPAVTEAAAAAGRRVLAVVPGPAPAPRRPGGPAALPPPGDPAAGTAGLAIAGCCSQEPGGAPAEDPGPVFAACERVLRPGGVLAVIAGPAAPGGTLAGLARSVVTAARAAGLVYAQHIVLVRAGIDGDRLAPAAPGTGSATPGGSPVHDDLLVFTKPGGDARS